MSAPHPVHPRSPRTLFNHRLLRLGVAGAAIALLAACGSLPLPDKPVRPAVYDLGLLPKAALAPAAAGKALPSITLSDTLYPTALDSTAVWYRLAYDNAQQLRPYALARWSMPPAQLVEQRVHDVLAQQRTVLGPMDPVSGAMQLRLEVQEFSQVFASATQSEGTLRLRATVTADNPSRVIGQRAWTVSRPAPTADAPGGVRALTDAVDGVAVELAQWITSLR